jgi:hypothetical protein
MTAIPLKRPQRIEKAESPPFRQLRDRTVAVASIVRSYFLVRRLAVGLQCLLVLRVLLCSDTVDDGQGWRCGRLGDHQRS